MLFKFSIKNRIPQGKKRRGCGEKGCKILWKMHRASKWKKSRQTARRAGLKTGQVKKCSKNQAWGQKKTWTQNKEKVNRVLQNYLQHPLHIMSGAEMSGVEALPPRPADGNHGHAG